MCGFVINYLIPWPGPHFSLLMKIFSDPCIIEIQSSPVAMVLFVTCTLMELLIWMPSVLGLVSGATSLSLCNLTFEHLVMNMWKPLGFSDLMFCTTRFWTSAKKRLCIPKIKQIPSINYQIRKNRFWNTCRLSLSLSLTLYVNVKTNPFVYVKGSYFVLIVSSANIYSISDHVIYC